MCYRGQGPWATPPVTVEMQGPGQDSCLEASQPPPCKAELTQRALSTSQSRRPPPERPPPGGVGEPSSCVGEAGARDPVTPAAQPPQAPTHLLVTQSGRPPDGTETHGRAGFSNRLAFIEGAQSRGSCSPRLQVAVPTRKAGNVLCREHVPPQVCHRSSGTCLQTMRNHTHETE